MWPNYLDITDLTQKQQSDVCFVFNTSIMRYPGNEFKPDQQITRGELASILNRTLQTLAVATPGDQDGPENPAPDVNAAEVSIKLKNK